MSVLVHSDVDVLEPAQDEDENIILSTSFTPWLAFHVSSECSVFRACVVAD